MKNKLKPINYYIEHLLLIGLFGTMVLPSVTIGVEISMITIVSFLLMGLLPFLIMKKSIKLNRFTIFWILILTLIFYSINHSYIILGVKTTYRDYMEWFRYFQVLPYLLLASLIRYQEFEKKLIKYVQVSVIYIVIVSFLEVTNIANIAYLIGNIYSSVERQVSEMIGGTHRIIVTGNDPNIGAFITIFLTAVIYSIKMNLFIKTLELVALFAVLLMTQSRTALLALTISILIYILVFTKLNFFIKVLIVLIISIVVYQLILFLNFKYILVGFEMAIDGTNNSLNSRFENMILAYERFSESQLLGWGPAKSIHNTIIDSEYAMILQRYGLIGILIFLTYLSLMLHSSIYLAKYYIDTKVNITIIGFLVSIMGGIIMLTNSFFAGYQSVSIFVITIILLISYKDKLKSEINYV